MLGDCVLLLNVFFLISIIFHLIFRPIQLLGVQADEEDEFVIVQSPVRTSDQEAEVMEPPQKLSVPDIVAHSIGCNLSERVRPDKRLVNVATQTQESSQVFENNEKQRNRYRTRGLYFGLLVGGLCCLYSLKSKS